MEKGEAAVHIMCQLESYEVGASHIWVLLKAFWLVELLTLLIITESLMMYIYL